MEQHRAVALHYSKVVQQFEAFAAASRDAAAAVVTRDQSMADNVQWLRQQGGPNAKIILSSHNDHINNVPNYVGGILRQAYGADYATLGFGFGRGMLNAITVGAPGPVKAELVPPGSIENVFLGSNKPLLLVDMRTVASGGSEAISLARTIKMRSIGSTFDPSRESLFFRLRSFPLDFDMLMFVADATQSTLLPFVK